jgi:hypothetical protein
MDAQEIAMADEHISTLTQSVIAKFTEMEAQHKKRERELNQ